MTRLTVTVKGQVTFWKDVLKHLGVSAGDKVEVDLLPDGRAELRAAVQEGSFEALAGFLKGKTNGKVLSIEEVNDAIAEASAAGGLLKT